MWKFQPFQFTCGLATIKLFISTSHQLLKLLPAQLTMIVIQLLNIRLDCNKTMRSCDLLFVELCRLCEDWRAEEGGGGGGEMILGLNCCCTTGEICKYEKMIQQSHKIKRKFPKIFNSPGGKVNYTAH